MSKLNKAISRPGIALKVARAIVLGQIFRLRHAFNPNVRIGRHFRAHVWPKIDGPGRVVIGDRVSMYLSYLRRPCFLTHTPESTITIGAGTGCGGARFSCVSSITLGEECMLGACSIVDSDVIPGPHDVITPEWKERYARPISIGPHVWIGINAVILTGATIPAECVLGGGAVIRDQEVADRALMLGNPARKIGVTREA